MKSFIIFLVIGAVLLVGLFVTQGRQADDGNLHLVFCDVGQGDAVFIRTPEGTNIMFDGGPDRKVLSCLTNHMPFWDRTIELVFLSHPHADHLLGLLEILERYTVRHFMSEDLANTTPEYKELEKQVQERNIIRKDIFRNDGFTTADGVRIAVLGPTKEYLERTSPNGTISSKEFASLIIKVSYQDFSVLLTGDSQAIGLEEAIMASGQIDVLQVPHHGSRTGLTSEILTRIKPKVSVISVGKNSYGHPSPETLNLLQESDSVILRTDREGDIEIVSDGKKWWIE